MPGNTQLSFLSTVKKMMISQNLPQELFNSLNQDNKNAIHQFCLIIVKTLSALESAIRQLHPPLLPKISQALTPCEKRFNDAQKNFSQYEYPKELLPVTSLLNTAAEHIKTSLDDLINTPEAQTGIKKVLKAMLGHANAQEILYPIHKIIPVVSQYFLEAPMRDHYGKYDATGEHRQENGLSVMPHIHGKPGGYHLYVPETCDASKEFPLVVALHGGAGSGREFIWFWLREARTRSFILLAPSSSGRTWSFNHRLDADQIISAINEIAHRYIIDKEHILLTGFSDGAIYTLTCALTDDLPFTAFAPISGVLHPSDLSNANGKHIYLVHGTLDWMFSARHAKLAYEILKTAGANITYNEISDLSHTYPREENDRILKWFDPSLALA